MRDGERFWEERELTGVTPRHVRRLGTFPRDGWIELGAREREEIRTFHDDQGHTWDETAKRFGVLSVRRRAYRAREECAAEEKARQEPPLPFDDKGAV